MQLPDSLKYRIFEKKCILFLGAGATLESGGALGKDLSKYIFDNIGDTGVAYNDDLARYTYNLVKKGYREEIEKIVRVRFKNQKPSDNFSHIAAIPWKSIYTTNYDDLIEKSYGSQRYFEYDLANVELPKSMVDNPIVPLYKINGDINTPFNPRKPLIITLDDLKQNNLKNKKMIERLMNDLNDTFVFIGYSFGDKIITDILDGFLGSKRWESIKYKYFITPEVSEEIEADLEVYRIRYIEGTADKFFKYINSEIEKDYKNKLRILKGNFSGNTKLSGLESRTQSFINECFDFYDKSKMYSTDGTFFYRGGTPSWGIIKENFDVSRKATISYPKTSLQTVESKNIANILANCCAENKLKKILVKGPSVSGKTTLLYRLAFDLMNMDILAFIYKPQTIYRSGLLYHIYEKANSPFVVLVDSLVSDYSELFKMIDDTQKNRIPVLFVMATRHSDWENVFSNFNKSRLSPFDIQIELSDSIDGHEAEILVSKMIASGIINTNTEFEKDSLIRKFQNGKNLIEILFEIMDRSEISDSICDEFDTFSNESQLAYGIISLTYKYGIKLKWEMLKRTIEQRIDFTWEDFVDKILNGDAKNSILQEELQGNYFVSGRHRFISELIISIYYKGNYSEEVNDYKRLIESGCGNFENEYYIGSLLNSIIKNDQRYPDAYIIDILNTAIDSFEFKENSAFVNHLKGEFYIEKGMYKNAITCLDANVQHNLNEMHSLHSLGKAYYYLAKTEDYTSAAFRNHINSSIEKLMKGVKKFPNNEYFYSFTYAVYAFLKRNDVFSEEDEQNLGKLEQLAMNNFTSDDVTRIKQFEY